MYKLPSLQKEYTLVYSGDPALALPEDEADRDNALRVARETGMWQAICHANQNPTLFHLRPLPHSAFEWLVGESTRKQLTQIEFATLAFRLAWRGVDHLTTESGAAIKVDTVIEDSQTLVKREVIDLLATIGGDAGNTLGLKVIAELAGEAIRRASEGLSPKR